MAGIGALYVHVPFCARKCAYCDFASRAVARDDGRFDAYVKDRVKEVQRLSNAGLLGAVRTAYLGGGTPTLLGPARLERLVQAVRYACPELREFSCEANPDSLSDEVIAAMVGAGATRVSVGVQSLDDAELVELGRLHTAAQARERVAAAVASGLDVSVDLMCAIPLQTDASWERTLRGALELGVDHVSVYPLVIEEGTAFERRYADDECAWNDTDVQARCMEAAERILEAAGFVRYEVASYARAGHACVHNMAYWTGVPYVGLGWGAASMMDAQLYEKVAPLLGWPGLGADSLNWTCVPECGGQGLPRVRYSSVDGEIEVLSPREAWAEDLMLGMRMTHGVDARLLDAVPDVRDGLVDRGLAALVGERFVPTHDGWLLGNELYGALWELAEA